MEEPVVHETTANTNIVVQQIHIPASVWLFQDVDNYL